MGLRMHCKHSEMAIFTGVLTGFVQKPSYYIGGSDLNLATHSSCNVREPAPGRSWIRLPLGGLGNIFFSELIELRTLPSLGHLFHL